MRLQAAAGLFGPTTPIIGFMNDTSPRSVIQARVSDGLTAVRTAYAASNTAPYGAFAACYWQIQPLDPTVQYIRLQVWGWC